MLTDTDNLQYLQNNLKHTGFGEKLNAELEKQLKVGTPESTLRATEYYSRPDTRKDNPSARDKLDYALQFRNGKADDRHFFNSYTASLEKNGRTAEHKFYIDKDSGMTRKEAYNLLDGRAVHKELKTKEGETYNAWLKLDPEKKDAKKPFLSYGEGYGYDVVKALAKHPVKQLGDEVALKKVVGAGEGEPGTGDVGEGRKRGGDGGRGEPAVQGSGSVRDGREKDVCGGRDESWQ